jgi:hypothetical protein
MKAIQFDNSFKALIPDTWELQKEDNTYSIYDSLEGVGALNVTTYTITDAKLLNVVDELREYLDDNYEEVNVTSTKEYAYAEKIDQDGIYWRYWMLKGVKSVMLISYNCDAGTKCNEKEVINAIIASLL